jgi:hypothetical protein
VVVQVVGVWHGFQEFASPVERDFSGPAVPDPCPCFGFLRCELDGHAVTWSGFNASARRRDDAVVVAGCQVDPGPDLVRPRLDLAVIGLSPQGERGLARGLGGLAIA